MSPTTEFFKAKKERAEADSVGIDWAVRRQRWLNHLSSLYADIQNWLVEPIRRGYVQITTEARDVSEPHVGTYRVDDLTLSVGDERVTFRPRGTIVVGAAGRVDVQGDAGEAMVVVQPDGRWGLVQAKVPQLRVTPLTDDSLDEMVRSVMRR